MKLGWILVAALVVPCTALAAEKGEKEDLAGMLWPTVEKGMASSDMFARARAYESLAFLPARATPGLIQEAVRDPHWIVRKAGIKVLAGRGEDEGRQLAMAALRDPSVPLEEDAFDLVSAFKPADGRAMLLAAIQDPANPAREKLMAATLTQPRAVLIDFFRAGLAKGDPWFAEKLASVRREDRVVLIDALVRDKDPKVASAAIDFAMKTDMKVGADVLSAAFKAKDEALRNAAAELLAKGGDKAAAKALLPLADKDDASRMRFLRAAANAPSEDLLPRLKKYLIVKPPAEGKAEEIPVDELTLAYRALAGTGDEGARKRIENDLESTYIERRIAATRAVGRLMGIRALPKLNALLGDGNVRVRSNAAEAIGELGQADSVEILERALREPDRDVRLAVVRALGHIHDKSVIIVARFLTGDMDPEVKKEALLGIARVSHETGWDDLRSNLDDPDHTTRFNVFRSMVNIDAARAIEFFDRSLAGLEADDLLSMTEQFKASFLPYLKVALASDRAWARQTALRAIAMLPDAEVAFLKEAAALGRHADARKIAMNRLKALSCKEAQDVAGALATDKDPEVRVAAIDALATCPGPATAEVLKKIHTEDLDLSVRVAAAQGMLRVAKGPAPKAATPKATPKKK